MPEWPMGTGCKPVGLAYVGSNPASPTRKEKASQCEAFSFLPDFRARVTSFDGPAIIARHQRARYFSQ